MPTLGVVISEGGTITLDAVVAGRQRKKGVLRVFGRLGWVEIHSTASLLHGMRPLIKVLSLGRRRPFFGSAT